MSSSTTSPKKLRANKVKVPPPVEKLAYHKTPEELDAFVLANVKRQFAPK
jgi:hypothetical protein